MNKESGLDVRRIDYIARDTTVVLGKGIHFSWKYISIKLYSNYHIYAEGFFIKYVFRHVLMGRGIFVLKRM